MEGTYIFCAIQKPVQPSFGEVVLDGVSGRTYMITHDDMAFVAARVPQKIYHPNKDNLMAHQSILSSVMEKQEEVIPVSFGNVFKTDEDAKVILKKLEPQFIELFPEIKNKVELGLKIIGKQEWLEEEVHKDPAISKLQSIVSKKSKEAGYYDRMKLGELTQRFFTDKRQEIEKQIMLPLQKIATAAKSNDPISEKMLLNSAFLLAKEKEAQFDEAVNELHDEWGDKVEFKYSGPWPAYNFVNIRLKVEKPS
ncbi:GvpL/GvpF family gas vesicle protein [Terribacillus saccharophilus]|uniref:GvpL/GvpF family gas vesicle protein n=1 Tax=Terribacillus saccharophilus TaxID=361277 RepID=UPI003981D9AB